MNPHPFGVAPHDVDTHVWSGLPDDLQQRTVRLLAQLAYARFRQTAPPPTPERNDEHPAQPQDPSRPS